MTQEQPNGRRRYAIFHSYLLHRSEDNCSANRRSAMVYHYGRTGTQPARELLPAQKLILRWEEVAH